MKNSDITYHDMLTTRETVSTLVQSAASQDNIDWRKVVATVVCIMRRNGMSTYSVEITFKIQEE